jgi:hypothetical protein
MCITFTVWSANKGIQETALFHQGDDLYIEERVIDGEAVSIWGKDVVTAVKEAIIKRNALTKTLGKHRVCGNQLKVTHSPSQLIGR